MIKTLDEYCFEQGPIRTPSESESLLLRITRNCKWKKCTFCPVYVGQHFSERSVEHIKRDIDSVYKYVEILKQRDINRDDIIKIAKQNGSSELRPAIAAFKWFSNGMKSVFLQDADSLSIKPADMISILRHLKMCFPDIQWIATYSRSSTIAQINDYDLEAMKNFGLTKIYIGLESGSNEVLKMIEKGATKDIHIKAGIKVKKAGMELSEYVMPGLGGMDFSEIHIRETIDLLNRINPDFIRIRALSIPKNVPLSQDCEKGLFKRCTEVMVVQEILELLEKLDVTSSVESRHMVNLFEIEGRLPQDKRYMMSILENFLEMPFQQQKLYQAGKRLGIFFELSDTKDQGLVGKVEKKSKKLKINPENIIDEKMEEMIKKSAWRR